MLVIFGFSTVFILLFSYLILKTKVYSHHLVSLIIISILGIILIVLNLYNNENFYFWKIFVTLVTEILFQLEIVIFKYTMKTKFSSPYEVCFFAGFFEIIINLLLLIIFQMYQSMLLGFLIRQMMII